MNTGIGCVYLIGAGCGDMDLITLRGLRLLQRCDVVVYDDLIAPQLLDAAPERAQRIYMGKRRGRHSASQEEICRVLAEKAREGSVVARLKGGDPFVFSRGGEEALALRAAGIPYEEVPGISSAIAIPAAAGIPVTHRGASRSLHIVTGHTAGTENGLPEGMDHLAALPGTLVFLMGLAHLEALAAALLAAGKEKDTPAAVVSGGNAAHPAAVRGTLETIAQKTRLAGVEPPAVIVVGQVAALDLSATVERPLGGVRVGLTGTAAVTERLRSGLEEQGAAVFQMERSVVEELPLEWDLERLCGGGRRWLVFTSANGVRIFFRRLREARMDLRRLANCSFAVIGASTGRLLEAHGIRPELCPEVYTSAGLAAALCARVAAGEDVILLRSRRGTAELPRTLRARGIPVEDVPLYDLHADPRTAETAREAVSTLDYLVFSSASGVELFFADHGTIPAKTVCVCIGEVTAGALEARFAGQVLTAKDISTEGLIETISNHKKQEGSL